MSEVLKGLISRRGVIKSALTRTSKYIHNYNPTEGNIYQLKSRLPVLREIFKDYQDIQNKIEDLDANQENDRDSFESNYFDADASLLQKIDDHEKSINRQASATASSSRQSTQIGNARVPILDLPKFSGSYLEWTSFQDTFIALIHNSSLYSNVEKFYYLRSCLKGDAHKILDAFVMSDDNYHSAWETLKSRYENLRIIIQEHVMAILNSPPVSKNSHTSLRKLLDDLTINLAALKSLKQPTEHWDTLLTVIITSKFDFITKREWESTLNAELPNIAQLKEFMSKRCFLLESLNPSDYLQSNSKSSNHTRQITQNKSRMQCNVATKAGECYHCKKAHTIYYCEEFLQLNIPERLNVVKNLKLCTNCLKNNHQLDNCKAGNYCRHCKLRHNSLLHEVIIKTPMNSNVGSVTACANDSNNCQILLSTAEILVESPVSNTWIKCRALLDQGSQLNFIKQSLRDKLGLTSRPVNYNISGINNIESNAKELVKIKFKSHSGSFLSTADCLVLQKITENLPLENFSACNVTVPSNLTLADPKFHTSSAIDILLGANIFWKIILSGQIKADPSRPHFQETQLGWIVGGSVKCSKPDVNVVCNLSLNNLSKQISKFWEIEDYPVINTEKQMSLEEIHCEKYFEQTVNRDHSGRFIVKLPFRNNPAEIGDTKTVAIKRLNSLENKFKKDINLKLKYTEFINEYLDLGHMSLINTKFNKNNYVYLPHHGVVKENSSTTKLRVVFDGSAKSSTNVSLNDTLSIGPKILNDLIAILLRFRIHQYVFTADVNKMYRQILIDPEDRKYQAILWREATDQDYQSYQLNTVTYGLSSAPYLAIKCLHKLANESQQLYPITSQIILNDFYMDDVLTGSNSIESACEIRNELVKILNSGCFELRKFASNNLNLLPKPNNAESDIHLYNFDKNGDSQTLGMIWNCLEDNFRYEINVDLRNLKYSTKRKILSTIAKIYDPLQLLGPIIVRAKLIMQEIWKINLGWDEQVPIGILNPWTELIEQLEVLNEIKIPRKAISLFPYETVELHGFCDSSQSAYGVCIYLRTICNGQITASLLCAKSKVAPLKTVTIPRLELCSAVMLSRVVANLQKQLNINIDKTYYWTDSMIVLAWLNTSPSNLKTFIANRVSEIQQNCIIDDWRHVKSALNPADIISRGILPKELLNNKFWFNGPEWLKQSTDYWPNNVHLKDIEVLETKQITLISCNTHTEFISELLHKFSSFNKLIRVTAWILRFGHNTKNSTKRTGLLTVEELNSATIVNIKLIQKLTFQDEIRNLENNKEVNSKSKLSTLNPFLDETGVIRVGGRIVNADLNFDKKFPIVLPKHFITKLIIESEHRLQLHAGPTGTLAAVRQKYWPLDGRNQVREIIRKCITCFRSKPTYLTPKMGNLPADRVSVSRPFQNCGVDYAGPISIKEGGRRSRKLIKAYICLFVCFATKAIHLELVSDLTSESFINALKRFVSRRGIVVNIYSDNASNFKGAQRELKDLFNLSSFEKISNYIKSVNINWNFIPARSPHFGGIWETGIKSTKFHLKRVIGNTHLTFEEMITLLTAIEACLNSRPLCPLTEDPSDLNVLTPGHFLIGCPLTAPPEPNLQEIPTNRLSRWQHVERMRQHFWNRWSREYLSQLQQRSKWQRDPGLVINVDSVVLLKDPTPPLTWKIGRVVKLHSGSDGIVRVVTIKTATGDTKRSVKTVCVLPIK